MREVDELVATGVEVIALDCSFASAMTGYPSMRLLLRSKKSILISCSCGRYLYFEEGKNAWEAGVDFVGTTLSGYTEESKNKMVQISN